MRQEQVAAGTIADGSGGASGGQEGTSASGSDCLVVGALAAQLQQPPVLRMAVCDLYKAEHSSSWRGDGYRVRDVDSPWRADVLLPLDELGQKVVACFEGRSAGNAQGQAAAVFIAYGNLSGSM